MVKVSRVESEIFSIGSLTASSAGLFDAYSSQSLNGNVKSVWFGDGNYTSTGSILLFESGLGNSNLMGLILNIRAGSTNQVFYPYTVAVDNKIVAGSFTNQIVIAEFGIHGPLRVVGSGLGANTSGTLLMVRYV